MHGRAFLYLAYDFEYTPIDAATHFTTKSVDFTHDNPFGRPALTDVGYMAWRPPFLSSLWVIMFFAPIRALASAASSLPACPAPTTTTSYSSFVSCYHSLLYFLFSMYLYFVTKYIRLFHNYKTSLQKRTVFLKSTLGKCGLLPQDGFWRISSGREPIPASLHESISSPEKLRHPKDIRIPIAPRGKSERWWFRLHLCSRQPCFFTKFLRSAHSSESLLPELATTNVFALMDIVWLFVA